MEKIELDIKDNGYVSCKYIDNKEEYYINYNELLGDITYIMNHKDTISRVCDGTLYFGNDNIMIIIKNYKNGERTKLASIINVGLKKYKEQKKKKIKGRKVSRNRLISTILIVSISATLTGAIGKNNEKNIEKTDHLKTSTTEYVYEDEFVPNTITDKNLNTLEVDYETEYFEKENTETISEEVIANPIQNVKIISLNVENRTDSEKYISAKENYYDIISRISLEYGIDPEIILAIATQEYGKHVIDENTPAIGLMQIELGVWNNQDITAYNFEKQTYETLHINREKLTDLEFNIRVACMYFQNCLVNSNYDLNIAIQMYNFGYGNIEKTFKLYHQNNNISLKDSLKNYNDEWLGYREYIDEGDKNYLEHVVSYIENIEEIKIRNIDGEDIFFAYSSQNNTIKM